MKKRKRRKNDELAMRSRVGAAPKPCRSKRREVEVFARYAWLAFLGAAVFSQGAVSGGLRNRMRRRQDQINQSHRGAEVAELTGQRLQVLSHRTFLAGTD